MPLDPQLVSIVEAANQRGATPLWEMSAPAAREAARQALPPQGPTEPVASVVDRSIPAPAGEIPIRIYRPEGEGPFGVIVYYHGSGFVLFDLDSHDGVCRALCRRAGVVVVSVDYRLAPEHKFPAAPEDCYAALLWVARNVDELRGDPDRLAVGGDSAGGCLAAVTAQMTRDRGGPSLSFQLLVYPVTDCRAAHPSMDENAEAPMLTKKGMLWFIDQYVRDEADKLDSLCSPLLAASFADLAPALVITAEYDPLRDEGEAYARALQAAGVPATLSRYDGMIHGGFQMESLVEASRRMVEEAVSAVRSAIG